MRAFDPRLIQDGSEGDLAARPEAPLAFRRPGGEWVTLSFEELEALKDLAFHRVALWNWLTCLTLLIIIQACGLLVVALAVWMRR